MPRGRVASFAAVVSLALALVLSACAPVSEEGTPSSVVSQAGGGADADHADEEGGGQTDGQADPEQETTRTGPVAQYGGPAYGDQGTAEVLEDGAWCKTLAVFWGGDQPVPAGVSFTFETAVVSPGGLTVESAVCGTRNADRACLGLTVAADEDGIFCSLLLRPDDAFADGTTITFTGTLDCPTSEVCDQVAARKVDPGPPIVVNDPDGS
ncbi:hypothetical protein GCM10022200_05010 [Microbacterium awajiense]|uniref:Lipoprotein n=2 Tax=Microbacterium awajiense TaxID=415214 RepID=A0ABP7A6E3_9MICO